MAFWPLQISDSYSQLAVLDQILNPLYRFILLVEKNARISSLPSLNAAVWAHAKKQCAVFTPVQRQHLGVQASLRSYESDDKLAMFFTKSVLFLIKKLSSTLILLSSFCYKAAASCLLLFKQSGEWLLLGLHN